MTYLLFIHVYNNFVYQIAFTNRTHSKYIPKQYLRDFFLLGVCSLVFYLSFSRFNVISGNYIYQEVKLIKFWYSHGNIVFLKRRKKNYPQFFVKISLRMLNRQLHVNYEPQVIRNRHGKSTQDHFSPTYFGYFKFFIRPYQGYLVFHRQAGRE